MISGLPSNEKRDFDHVGDRFHPAIVGYFLEKSCFISRGTKLFAMTLKASASSAPLLVRPSQGIEVSIAAISANDLGEQTLLS